MTHLVVPVNALTQGSTSLIDCDSSYVASYMVVVTENLSGITADYNGRDSN